VQTILNEIMDETEIPQNPLICGGERITSNCFTLNFVKCHKMEDYIGADECLLKIY
jgi:hypothetical protein